MATESTARSVLAPSQVAPSPGADPPQASASSVPMRGLTVALSAFSALSAIAGGAELILYPRGNAYMPTPDVLQYTPFDNFVIPGLLLGLWVGGTSAACALLSLRRSRFAIDSMLLAGGTLSCWIVAEFAMLRVPHWLHALYLGVGAVLTMLGLRGALTSPHPRHRYVAIVTAAEATGFVVPIATGVLLQPAIAPGGFFLSMVIAGALEGAALGFGQASALPTPVNRARFTRLTAAAAALTWGAAMLTMQAITLDMPVALQVLLAIVTGSLGLGALGSAQWLELRRYGPHARRWILWTALSWTVALPMSFLPGLFVDEATPTRWQLPLWSAGGVLMAYTMALITWQGARRLLDQSQGRGVTEGSHTAHLA